MDLSIIIPFVGEYPQVLFTIQAVNQQLQGSNIKYEVIAVNNYCDQVQAQADNLLNIAASKLSANGINKESLILAHKMIMPTYEDKSGEAIKASANRGNPWLKYLEYSDRLSHWQAKRYAVEYCRGRILLFLDAHVIPSKMAIPQLYDAYTNSANDYFKQGSMHLPLSYKILEYHRLIYKLVIDKEYSYGYSFTSFRPENEPYEVPCMSTCGMMISRAIYDSIGGLPIGLGIYGGGENFINFTLSVLGYKKFIYPLATLFHHGEKRDYHYIGDDYTRNKMIAHYLFGGLALLENFTSIAKGNKDLLAKMALEVVEEHKNHRAMIKRSQVISIEEWAKTWF